MISKKLILFFKDLYTSGPHTADPQYLIDRRLPQLSHQDRQWLDRVLDQDEIENSIKTMQLRKSPGTDGLNVEFYQCFWEQLRTILYRLYQEIVHDQQFHLSARRGVIFLIEKLAKDSLWIANWRPLTLMNVDYKIFAKILATRIQKVIDPLIHADQSGFLKGTYISENLLELLTTIEYCQKKTN